MAKGETHDKDNGIVFGNWRLVPCEGPSKENWELCHLRDSKTKDGETVRRWMRCGRFYQWNTINLALEYAADWEMREGSRNDARKILYALSKYAETLDAFRAAFWHRDTLR